ncbi:hypothetical protein ACFB49_20780 [Sphingomonas sp. DBB INV C78]
MMSGHVAEADIGKSRGNQPAERCQPDQIGHETILQFRTIFRPEDGADRRGSRLASIVKRGAGIRIPLSSGWLIDSTFSVA